MHRGACGSLDGQLSDAPEKFITCDMKKLVRVLHSFTDTHNSHTTYTQKYTHHKQATLTSHVVCFPTALTLVRVLCVFLCCVSCVSEFCVRVVCVVVVCLFVCPNAPLLGALVLCVHSLLCVWCVGGTCMCAAAVFLHVCVRVCGCVCVCMCLCVPHANRVCRLRASCVVCAQY